MAIINLIAFLIFIFGGYVETKQNQQHNHLERILKTDGLVALWDFKEEAGKNRESYDRGNFSLQEINGTVPRINDGPLSGYSAVFGDGPYLSISNDHTGELNIYGPHQGLTVMAWIKWEGGTGFVGGMWNEYTDGGKRQYGLFVSLGYYNGADQVCGHISKTGGPTPPFPYSIDYSASAQKIKNDVWQCVAFTYDGIWIKSYLNGEFTPRRPELIDHTTGFEGYPEGLIKSKNPYFFPDGIGNNGSDFTVGAVQLASGMGNLFRGQIAGLAVFNRQLSEKEIRKLSKF